MDDRHLLKLAQMLAPRDYIPLGITLGIAYPQLETILEEKRHRYTEAFLVVFHRWKASQPSDGLDLRMAMYEELREADLAGVADQMIDIVSAGPQARIQHVKKMVTDAQLVRQEYDTELHQPSEHSTKHSDAIQKNVTNISGKEPKQVDVYMGEQAKPIHTKAGEKVTISIHANRGARLKQCQKNTATLREPIENRRREVRNDGKAIANTSTQKKIKDVQHGASGVMQDLESVVVGMETILRDNTKPLKGAQQLIASRSDIPGRKGVEGVVKHKAHTVRRVQCVEGKGNEKYNGPTRGDDGKWELSSTGKLPCDIIKPCIVGYASDDDIIISDFSKNHTYCFNIKNKLTTRVITSDGKTCVTSCALLDEDTIVCGKYISYCHADSSTGCISLYNRQWELIRDIAFPRNTSKDYAWVYVAVSQDGMIIAAEVIEKSLYVINPDDGCIVNMIRCADDIAQLSGVLTTGDVIALLYPPINKLLIIDRQGAQKEITHREDILNCGVDPLTDDLYVVFWDVRREMAVVDQLSGKGHQERAEVISFPLDETLIPISRPVITPLGDMVVCSGRSECLVLRKRFIHCLTRSKRD